MTDIGKRRRILGVPAPDTGRRGRQACQGRRVAVDRLPLPALQALAQKHEARKGMT